ncbi:MAG: hypothetical protein P4M05_22860, partial [Bradyrhizobium sp.]|nr:hypothetical protein [Bradyrhizobium sp.]
MSFKNWPLIFKVVSMLLLLGLASFASTIYASVQMSAIDKGYSALLNGQAKATTHLARSGRFLAVTQTSLYHLMVAATEADRKEALSAVEAAKRAFDEQLLLARNAVPIYGDKIDDFSRAYHSAVETTCSPVTRSANGAADPHDKDNALTALKSICEPAIDKTLEFGIVVNNAITADRDKMSADAAATTHTTIVTMLVGIGSALILVIGFAVFLVRASVVAPVQASIGVMAALGRGELADSVPGTERDDEVGAIAKSLETLRGQLQEAERQRN